MPHICNYKDTFVEIVLGDPKEAFDLKGLYRVFSLFDDRRSTLYIRKGQESAITEAPSTSTVSSEEPTPGKETLASFVSEQDVSMNGSSPGNMCAFPKSERTAQYSIPSISARKRTYIPLLNQILEAYYQIQPHYYLHTIHVTGFTCINSQDITPPPHRCLGFKCRTADHKDTLCLERDPARSSALAYHSGPSLKYLKLPHWERHKGGKNMGQAGSSDFLIAPPLLNQGATPVPPPPSTKSTIGYAAYKRRLRRLP